MRWFKIFERSGLLDCEAAPRGCRKSILQVAAAKEINPDRINYLTDSGDTTDVILGGILDYSKKYCGGLSREARFLAGFLFLGQGYLGGPRSDFSANGFAEQIKDGDHR